MNKTLFMYYIIYEVCTFPKFIVFKKQNQTPVTQPQICIGNLQIELCWVGLVQVLFCLVLGFLHTFWLGGLG